MWAKGQYPRAVLFVEQTLLAELVTSPNVSRRKAFFIDAADMNLRSITNLT